eukprot:6177846-Pleurochrysis_carterae.AAC.1
MPRHAVGVVVRRRARLRPRVVAAVALRPADQLAGLVHVCIKNPSGGNGRYGARRRDVRVCAGDAGIG